MSRSDSKIATVLVFPAVGKPNRQYSLDFSSLGSLFFSTKTRGGTINSAFNTTVFFCFNVICVLNFKQHTLEYFLKVKVFVGCVQKLPHLSLGHKTFLPTWVRDGVDFSKPNKQTNKQTKGKSKNQCLSPQTTCSIL